MEMAENEYYKRKRSGLPGEVPDDEGSGQEVKIALTAYLLLAYLKFRSRFSWSLYTLSAILPTNLFSRRNLGDWLNAPFHSRSLSPPPEPQLQLSFG